MHARFGTIEEHVAVVEKAHHGDPVVYVGHAKPLGEWARAMAKRLVPPIPTADGSGSEIKPYRVEWRCDLTGMWGHRGSYATYVEAMQSCRGGIRAHGGQCRIVVQHVAYVEGLGAGVPLP